MEWKTTKTDRNNLYISKVQPRSQAALGNVTVGSKLISLNGEMIEDIGAKAIYGKLSLSEMPLTITFLKPLKNILSKCTFNQRPLGFSVIEDKAGKNVIVSDIKHDKNRTGPLKIGWMIYEINGKYVHDMKHKDILKIVGQQSTPFHIYFKAVCDYMKHELLATIQNTKITVNWYGLYDMYTQHKQGAERVENHRILTWYRIIIIKWWIESFNGDYETLGLDIEWMYKNVGSVLRKITGFTKDSDTNE